MMGKIITRKHNPDEPFDDSDIDYSKADSMTEEQIEEAAKADPDAQPLTEEQTNKLKIRRPHLKKDRLKNG